MQDAVSRQTNDRSHDSNVARKATSVICGVASVGLLVFLGFAIGDAEATYGDPFEGGWIVFHLFDAAIAAALGAAAVVLWRPKGSGISFAKALLWAALVAIAVLVVFLLI